VKVSRDSTMTLKLIGPKGVSKLIPHITNQSLKIKVKGKEWGNVTYNITLRNTAVATLELKLRFWNYKHISNSSVISILINFYSSWTILRSK
jgi:hypothetical protein